MCTYVPSRIAFSSTEQEYSILIRRTDICDCFERPNVNSVEKTEDERVVQVPNVCPKTNTNAVKFTSQFYEAE